MVTIKINTIVQVLLKKKFLIYLKKVWKKRFNNTCSSVTKKSPEDPSQFKQSYGLLFQKRIKAFLKLSKIDAQVTKSAKKRKVFEIKPFAIE